MAEVENFVFNSSDESPAESVPEPDEKPAFSWTADEFVAHDKNGLWYASVIGIALAAAIGVYFIEDIVAAVIVVFIGIMFCVVGARRPRELPYSLDTRGITVDKKFYPYTSFKSFSIVQEAGIESIWFAPMQRFNPGLWIYFSPEEGKKIADYLSLYLPFEPRELDYFDRLMHQIRF